MPKADPERLAAALRANLHRRKAQSRALAQRNSSETPSLETPQRRDTAADGSD